MCRIYLTLVVLVVTTAMAWSQTITNDKVEARAVREQGKITGFVIRATNGPSFTVRFGSSGNIWAQAVQEEQAKGVSRLVFTGLEASPTPRLGRDSRVVVELTEGDPYPLVSFTLNLQAFNKAQWEARFGTVPFHFMVLSMPGAEMFYQRGWQIPTPIVDPYPMQGKHTGYGKQIRSEWDDNWTYAPPLGAYPLPDVGLWWPSKSLFACYDFHEARLTDHSEKDLATAYVWRQGDAGQFICLAWPYAGGYREELRYPEKLPATLDSHFHFLWSEDAASDRDPNLIVNEFVWGRYADLLPEVARVNDLSWLPEAHRPSGYSGMKVGQYYGRITKENARWWKEGALTFGGLGWDRSAVDYALDAKDAESAARLRDNIEFMAPRVQWMTIGGDRCCAWQQCLEGEAIDMFDGGVPTVHNAQTWQMALLFLDAYRNAPDQYAKYLDIVDGHVLWTKRFLYTRNDYADVPCAQFCWAAAPATAFCLRYYYTFRNDPQRGELAELAYRLVRNTMYHFLPTWLSDNDDMDNLDSFSFCEPNAGISWLGAACSNEVWCVTYAALMTYLATGDPWLGYYVCGAVNRWHELFRDEWYPTVRQYGDAFTEIYYLYPGRGTLGGRVSFGGLWGQVEEVAWPVGEATVRVTCGEKAAMAWNRAPGSAPLKVEGDRIERTGEPDPTRAGRHTDVADYRYYGEGQCSFRLARYGLGQAEPFVINVTFPMFDLRGKRVFLERGGTQRELERGKDFEEMANRWDTLVVRGLRYGDTVGVGKIDTGVAPLACEVARTSGVKPQQPEPAQFRLADLRLAANRAVSFDWEDPASMAGLEFGRRSVFGVPFDIINGDLSGGKIGVRDQKVLVQLPGRHLFLLVGERDEGARVTVTAGGKPVVVDLDRAVPALEGWPPCFQWELAMAEVALAGNVEALEARGCTLFAATTYAGPGDDKLAQIQEALKSRQELVAAEAKTVAELAALRPLFEALSGRLAILPPTPKQSARNSDFARLLHKAKLIQHVSFLTPEQLVDPGWFNTGRYWVAIYAMGENYVQTVHSEGDGDAALQAFLRSGGTLLVLPTQPFPFYYNETGKPVVNAGKFGLPICGSGYQGREDMLAGVDVRPWEKAPRDRVLTFHLNAEQDIVTSLPASFPFPLTEAESKVDERWRPIVNVVGETGRYVPILTLMDDRGGNYGEGAAMIDYTSGPLAPGRVLYVWSTLLSLPEYQSKLFSDVLRWVLSNTVAPPAQGACYFTSTPITIDGVLNEAAWQNVPDFELSPVIQPENVSQPTRAKVRWDRDNLYVAFVAEDKDIWATMKQRDQWLWEEEVVEVFVDHDGDGRDYKEFEVNPLNTVVDLNIAQVNHGDLDKALAWNSAGWKTAVRVEGTTENREDVDRRWVCEMALPLKDLAPADAQPRPGTVWRVNLYRIDRPNKQDPKQDVAFSAWSAVSKGYHEPQRFGFLTFAADPYYDDFKLHAEGQAPGLPWIAIAGEWVVKGGKLLGRNGGTDGWRATGLYGGLPTWTDYRLTVAFDVQQVGSDWRDGPWFGLRCLSTDGYFVDFTNREVQVHKSLQGRSTNDDIMVARWPYRLEAGPHEVALEVRGSKEVLLTVVVDGKELGEARDRDVLGIGPVPAGGIVLSPRRWGQSTSDTVVRYDSVKVELLK